VDTHPAHPIGVELVSAEYNSFGIAEIAMAPKIGKTFCAAFLKNSLRDWSSSFFLFFFILLED